MVNSDYQILKSLFSNLIYVGPDKPKNIKGLNIPFRSSPIRKIKLSLTLRMTPIGYNYKKIINYIINNINPKYDKKLIFFIEFTKLGFLAKILRQIYRNSLIIFNAHNIEVDYMSTNTLNPIRKLYSRINEKKAIKSANIVFVPKKEDIKRFNEIYGFVDRKWIVLPPCMDSLPSFSNKIYIPNKLRVLFVGSLQARQNIRAVNFISEKLLLLLPKNLKQKIFFTITGYKPSKKLIISLKSREIKVLPALSSSALDKLYSANDIFISPVVGGSGIKLKILDSLRHSIPVIASKDSLAGYNNIHRCSIIAESVQDYIDSFQLLLKCPSKLKKMSSEALLYFLRSYTPYHRKKIIISAFEELSREDKCK